MLEKRVLQLALHDLQREKSMLEDLIEKSKTENYGDITMDLIYHQIEENEKELSEVQELYKKADYIIQMK